MGLELSAQAADFARRNLEGWGLADRVRVRGKVRPVSLYEVLDAEPPPVLEARLRTLERYHAALESYAHRAFDAAAEQLEEIVAEDPEDVLAQVHLRRARECVESIRARNT